MFPKIPRMNKKKTDVCVQGQPDHSQVWDLDNEQHYDSQQNIFHSSSEQLFKEEAVRLVLALLFSTEPYAHLTVQCVWGCWQKMESDTSYTVIVVFVTEPKPAVNRELNKHSLCERRQPVEWQGVTGLSLPSVSRSSGTEWRCLMTWPGRAQSKQLQLNIKPLTRLSSDMWGQDASLSNHPTSPSFWPVKHSNIT